MLKYFTIQKLKIEDRSIVGLVVAALLLELICHNIIDSIATQQS